MVLVGVTAVVVMATMLLLRLCRSITAQAQHLGARNQSVYCTGSGAQDNAHMVALHLPATATTTSPTPAIRIAVVLHRQDDRSVVLVHGGEILMVIADKVSAVAARRVVYLKLGLKGRRRHRVVFPASQQRTAAPHVLEGGVKPVVGALHHHLGVGRGAGQHAVQGAGGEGAGRGTAQRWHLAALVVYRRAQNGEMCK